MKKKLLAIIITIPLIFSACVSSKEKIIDKGEDFNKVLIDMNKSAEEVSKKSVNIAEKCKPWLMSEEDYTKYQCENLFKYVAKYENGTFKFSEENECNYMTFITYDEAKEDIDMLFKLFRNCYAGYGYFGGDEVFYKAKEKILKELDGKKQIKILEFQELIFSNLEFLKDYHTNYKMVDKCLKLYYIGKDIDFFKNENGYYKINENKPYYIKQINNEKNLEKFMKLTINREGKLVYAIAVNQASNNEQAIKGIDVEVEYMNDKNISSEKINLKAIGNVSRVSKEISYSLKDGVPISKLGRMSTKTAEDTEIKEFIETGKKLKDYPVGIIDLRGTGGGDPKIGEEWFKNYTGEDFRSKSVDMKFNSNLIKYCLENNYNENKWSEPLFEVKPRYSGEYSRVKNKNVMFVLVDKSDVSASEIFIEDLKEMDNVILVGSNTGGCFSTGGVIMYFLKNSKIPNLLGTVLHLTPYSDEFEFKGFEPDILVDPSDSLDRVQKLIKYYKLNEKR